MTDSTTGRGRTPRPDMETIKILLRSGEGARALQRLGDRWSFLVLRDVFLGAHRFDDLRRLSGAARGTLSARLNALVEQGLLYRNPYSNSSKRVEYRLTDKGLAFYPAALCMWEWESRWGGKTTLPPRLIHARCSKEMHPTLVCTHCTRGIDPHEVSFEPGAGARLYASSHPSTRRRQSVSGSNSEGTDRTMFHTVDVLGDRWTALLIAALFFGLRRYDDINEALGIATNILADRLRHLLATGVLEQHRYCDHPPRYEYRFTQKGRSIYPIIVALHDWAKRWMPSAHGPGLILKHKPCKHPLHSVVVCSECHTHVERSDVRLGRAPRWRAAREPAATATRRRSNARLK